MKKDQFINKHQHLKIAQAELDRKYQAHLREQEEMQKMWEAAQVLATTAPQATVGGGGGGGSTAILEMTVDSTEYLSTYWCVTSSAPTTFTVDWGDGDIDEYNANGEECIEHEYEEIGIWNVVITFANSELITELEFND